VVEDRGKWRAVLSTGNEPSARIKVGEFLGQLTDCTLKKLVREVMNLEWYNLTPRTIHTMLL
jgi:hypothetical protein